MGNCVQRASKKTKKRHNDIIQSKNDKFFMFTSYDEAVKPYESMTKKKLETMLQDLSLEKSRYQELLSLTHLPEVKIEKLVVEIQKGLNFQKRTLKDYPGVYINLSLAPKGPSFDTPSCDLELSSWYYIFEIIHNIRPFKLIVFSAYSQRPDKDPKLIAQTSIETESLEDQKMVNKWIKMRKINSKKNRPKLLIRIQWVFDEMILIKRLVEESSEKMTKIESLLISQQLPIN